MKTRNDVAVAAETGDKKKLIEIVGKNLGKYFYISSEKYANFFILKFAQQIFSVLLFLYKDYFTQNINFLSKKNCFKREHFIQTKIKTWDGYIAS